MNNFNRFKTFILVSIALAVLFTQRAKTLNDYAYPLFFQAAGTHNPIDATTYYFGSIASAPITTAGVYRHYFVKYGSVRRIGVHILVLGTLGTTEAGEIYIRFNGTTANRIDNGYGGQPAIDWNAVFDYRFVDYGDDALYVTELDYFEIEVRYPTFATNPTIVAYYGEVFIEP